MRPNHLSVFRENTAAGRRTAWTRPVATHHHVCKHQGCTSRQLRPAQHLVELCIANAAVQEAGGGGLVLPLSVTALSAQRSTTVPRTGAGVLQTPSRGWSLSG
jgi:hypothetical protein